MYKKKLIALGIALTLVIGFFPFMRNNQVVAYTFPSSVGTYVNSIIKNGVTLTAYVSQLDTVYNSTNPYVHTGDTPFLVIIQIYNNNTSNCLVNSAGFDIRCKDASGAIISPTVSHIENLSPDLMAGFINENYIRVDPSTNFSYGNGIVVPAKRSIYMESIIYCSAINGTSSTGAITQYAPQLATDAMRLNQNMTVTVSDTYTYVGETADVNVLNTNLTNILNSLYNVEYTGNIFDYQGGQFYRVRYADYPVNDKLRLVIDRCIGKPVLIMSDQILDSTNDTNIVNATLRYPIVVSVYLKNTDPNHTYRNRIFNRIDNLWYRGLGFQLDSFSSNYYETYAYFETASITRFEMYGRYQVGGYSYIPPLSTLQTTITGHIDINYGDTFTVPDMDISGFYDNDLIMQTADDIYYPLSEWEVLRDIYGAFDSSTNSNNASASDDLANQSNQIHSQEQSYYQQNASAIESTGLKNYRFSGDQQNGIGAVSNDFSDLWNALGSWNSVYIFSLTLGLALTILRHAPHGIRKRKTSNSSSEGS